MRRIVDKGTERDTCPVYKRDPRVFDLYGYALTFGFCSNAEKAALYAHLLAAWRWGRGDFFWVGGEPGGVLCCGDNAFGMDDIVTDIKENAPVDEILKWQEYDAECRSLGISTLNYHAWLHGAPRHAEDSLRGLRELRDRIERARDDFAHAVDEYNEGGEGRP